MNNKIIIFDFDGTIADDIDILIEILIGTLKKFHSKNITKKTVDEFRNCSVSELFKKLEISDERLPELLNEIFSELNNQISLAKSFEGMPEVITQLKQERYKLGIITSNSISNVSSFLKANNLNHFDYLYTSAPLFGKDKILDTFLKREKLDPSEIIYIGDEIRDVEAAKKLNLKAGAAIWGFNSRSSLEKVNPDYLFITPKDLLSI